MRYQKHIFICTNQRPEGKKSCGEACGLALVDAFKKEIKEQQVAVKVRAQRAGCLDVCAHGPALVVYPEGVFYGKVQPEDVAEIVHEHLVHNRPVSRLVIPE